MKAAPLLLAHLSFPLLSQAIGQYQPFLVPYLALNSIPAPLSNDINLELFRRRDGNCAQGKSCANMGDENACCDKNTFCAVDQGGHVACCPKNAQCTGDIGGGGGAPTPTAGSGAIATAGEPLQAGITGSADGTVQNPYFPYPYLPTNYPNAAICTSSFNGCQSQYASCTNSLAGSNAPGVTVDGGDVGGVTRAGGGGQMVLVQATSVCSSLSVEACHRLTLPSCKSYGGPAGVGKGAKQSFVVDGNNGSNGGVPGRMIGCLGLGSGLIVAVVMMAIL